MIFLSYVSEDRARVLPYFDLLESHGLSPWMDCKKILGGQNWDYEIRTALDRAEIIVIFISNQSVDKNGYAQREIKLSLKRYEEKIEGAIFIVPVLLDDVPFPNSLKSLHCLGAFRNNIDKDLLQSLSAQSAQLGEVNLDQQRSSEVSWKVDDYSSQYSGIPGYAINTNKITLASSKYINIKEISEHINGKLAEWAMNSRIPSISPDPKSYSLLRDEWQRTNTFDAIFSGINVKGRVISIGYSLHWYNAGAAHPTHSPKTFNYILDPIIHINKPSMLFNGDDGLHVLRAEAMEQVSNLITQTAGGPPDQAWISEGTKDWDSFGNFFLTETGMNFEFHSYQVAAYVFGTPSISVNYDKLVPYFSDTALHALGLYRRA